MTYTDILLIAVALGIIGVIGTTWDWRLWQKRRSKPVETITNVRDMRPDDVVRKGQTP